MASVFGSAILSKEMAAPFVIIRSSVSPTPLRTSGVVFTGFALLGKYISKLFWPVHLLAYYVFPPRTKFFDPTVLAGVFELVSIVGLIVILQ
jgi:hypothetical protein